MRSTLSALVILAAATPALAADLPVGPGRAYATIGEAVAAAVPGDRIVVASGTYVENVTTGTPNLTFVAGKSVVWDGGGDQGPWSPCLEVTADRIVVQGFRFRAGAGHVVIHGTDARIRNCTSDGSRAAAIQVYGDRARIEACRVRGPAGTGIHVEGAHAEILRNRVQSAGEFGVFVSGDDGLAKGNTVFGTLASGIFLEGDDAIAVSNTVTSAAGAGVMAQGSGPVLRSNRVSHAGGGGLVAIGDVAVAEKNAVSGAEFAGVYVVGPSMSVVGNRVEQVGGEGAAFFFGSGKESGGGRVERNTAYDCTGKGFAAETAGVTFSADKAFRCGSRSQPTFLVNGERNTLTACLASEGEHTGFELRGWSNTLVRCTAVRNDGDGFQVWDADGTVTDCKATDNAAHGLVNFGADTALVRGRFLGNGQDLARGDGASWEEFDDPVFETGGKYELNLYEE